MKRLLMATVAMLVAVAWAGAATAAAQTQQDTDFSGGDARRDSGSRRGRSRAQPASRSPRTSRGRRCRPVGRPHRGAAGHGNRDRCNWNAHRRRSAGEHDAVLRLRSLARFRGHVHGGPVPARRVRRSFERRALGHVQHGRRSAASRPLRQDRGAWWGAGEHADRGHRSARRARLQHRVDSHEIRYFVDGAVVATHAIAIAAQLRPIASDFDRGRRQRDGRVLGPVPHPCRLSERRHLHVARLRRRRQPRHLADADRGARYTSRHRCQLRGPHGKHPDAGCLVDRLAAGRRPAARFPARSGGATSSTARR